MPRGWSRRGLEVATCVALTGCDVVFGLSPPTNVDAIIDVDPTAPRVAAPALFPDDAAAQAGPYLFEGTGYRFASVAQGTPGVHRPVPIAIDRLTPADTISIEIPPELGTGWEICGLPASGTVDLDAVLAAPCARGEATAAFTVVVPVSLTTGVVDAVSPLVVHVTREAFTYDLEIAILPLDENDSPTVGAGLFSIIVAGGVLVPSGGSRVEWRAVSDVELGGTIDARGRAGAGGACDATGCAGGAAGAGSTGNGASSSCGTPACAAAGLQGGGAGASCSATTCPSMRFAVGGGGGGGAVDGAPGGGASPACPQTAAGGAARTGDPWLLELATAGGGGGGAGAATDESGGTRYGSGGGGGGGVIAIEALGDVRFVGGATLDVRGGPGGMSTTTTCSGNVRPGIGGGGGGGAIRLRADRVLSSSALEARLRVEGGNGDGSTAGHGGRGHVRVDGLDATLPIVPGTVRGPDFDPPAPVTTTATLAFTARAYAPPGGGVHVGHRPAGSAAYLLADTGNSAAVTVPLMLAPGLNEVCVFATRPPVLDVQAIPSAVKRCTWVARVE